MGTTSDPSSRQPLGAPPGEEILQAALDVLSHPVLLGDAEGRIRYRNRRARSDWESVDGLAEAVGGAADLARILRLCRRPDEQVHCSPGDGPLLGHRLCVRTLCLRGDERWVMVEIDPGDEHQTRSIRLHSRLARQSQMLREVVEQQREERRRREALERSNEQLRERVLLDPLTGVRNRRGFDGEFELALRERRRAGAPLAVALVDVDHFKRVNDEFGHLRGDDYLRRIAETISQCCRRPRDLVARFGGDEFACLLPRTDEDGARALGLALRRAVARLALPAPGGDHIVSVSVGICVALGGDELAPTGLLEVADRALYEAKKSGRDGSVVRCVRGLGLAGNAG